MTKNVPFPSPGVFPRAWGQAIIIEMNTEGTYTNV